MNDNTALSKLQDLSERQLVTGILVPLFKALGYESVEDHHGPTEAGKDLICWRTNQLEEVELTVAQVKKYRPSARANDTKSFSTIVTQLSQCVEKSVPHKSLGTMRPSIVYLVTPYEIDTKLLQTRLEKLEALRSNRVRILDGLRIIKLIRQKLPDLLFELEDTRAQIARVTRPRLTNEVLLRALELEEQREVENYYTEMNFALGGPWTRLFLVPKFTGSTEAALVTESEWRRLVDLDLYSKKTFRAGLIGWNPVDVEKVFRKLEKRGRKWRRLRDVLRRKDRLSTRSIHDVEARIYSIIERLWQANAAELGAGETQEEVKHLLVVTFPEELKSKDGARRLTRRSVKKDSNLPQSMGWPGDAVGSERVDEAVTRARDALRLRLANDVELARARAAKEQLEATGRVVANRLAEVRRLRPPTRVKVELDGRALADVLNTERSSIESGFRLGNSGETGVSLGEAIRRCHRLCQEVDACLAEPLIANVLGVPKAAQVRANLEEDRLRLPLQVALEAGESLVILGAAGAGKTTCLQMHAHRLLSESEPEALVLYAPLPALGRYAREGIEEQARPTAGVLESALEDYLAALGVNTRRGLICEELTRRGGVVLLDALDELAGRAGFWFETISSFAEKHQNVQLLVTSRMSDRLLPQLPFFPISLVSFDDAQRRRFLTIWFRKKARPKTSDVMEHLDRAPEVAAIVRSPLLLTILCVLAENDVPLPNSEVRLYEERLKLMFGHYDLHKQINRLTSHSASLMLVARKLGFHLHLKERREMELEELDLVARQAVRSQLGPEVASRAVSELVDPCNVLVPMTDAGEYGFGHLRFQEYLAAVELVRNRGIDMVPLMASAWWRGSFVLFGGMGQDLEGVLGRVVDRAMLGPIRPTLDAMASALTGGDRARIEVILSRAAERQAEEDFDEYDGLLPGDRKW